MTLRRIAQEHANLLRDPFQGCCAGPVEAGDPRRWVGHISGPPGSSYEQEKFSVSIVFPEDYPTRPFQLTFTTPLSHPNVSEEGEVQLAELEDENWCSVQTVRSILICLQVLLSEPDLSEDALDSKAAGVSSKNNPKKQAAVSGATQDHVEPTHFGRKIGDKKYMVNMSRQEEYNNLVGVQEKDKFVMENADIVRDAKTARKSL